MRNEPMRRNDLPETCFSVLPSSGQLIIIRHGERGYYPSEWDTGSREENRRIFVNVFLYVIFFFHAEFLYKYPPKKIVKPHYSPRYPLN